jgi:hypothetical protein
MYPNTSNFSNYTSMPINYNMSASGIPMNYNSQVVRPINTTTQSNSDRIITGGFLGPFILGGITGGLLAPAFYPRQYYYPYQYYGTYYR